MLISKFISILVVKGGGTRKNGRRPDLVLMKLLGCGRREWKFEENRTPISHIMKF